VTEAGSPVPAAPSAERRQELVAEYQMVCASHDAITDFRAKLLALLPIASGAGVGFLISQSKGPVSNTTAVLLLAVGVFGLLVTVGLFFYEVRQIDICKQLRNHAAWLEGQMGMQAGQFGARRPRLSLHEVYRPGLGRARDRRFKQAEDKGRTVAEGPAAAGLPWGERPLIGAEAAGYIVYHAVMASWVVVAIVGIAEFAT
jgi:hypothetical protein